MVTVTPTSFSWRRCLLLGLSVAAVAAVGLWCFYQYGRSLWHPLMVKINGEASVADRIMMIEQRHPQLISLDVKSVALIAVKDPGYVDVFINNQHWQRFPFTAQSGKSGPKLQEGDGQIPEGIYSIVTLNPNSSYHLSLKVSYPNADDKARSDALGISDYGSDIYIHGKDASIGCVAIGDHAIEHVFYLVHKAELANVMVAIAPVDLLHNTITALPQDAVYDKIKRVMADLYK